MGDDGSEVPSDLFSKQSFADAELGHIVAQIVFVSFLSQVWRPRPPKLDCCALKLGAALSHLGGHDHYLVICTYYCTSLQIFFCAAIFTGCLTLTYAYECNSFRVVCSPGSSSVIHKMNLQSYATLSQKHNLKTRQFVKMQFVHILAIDLPHDLHLL